MRIQTTVVLLCLVSSLSAPAGCSRQYHAEDADRQVYGILGSTQQKEMGYPRAFSIDDSPSRNLQRTALEIIGPLPEAEGLPEWLAESSLARSKAPLREIDLAAALRLAQHNSRQFQDERETLYLTALALTTQIHAFEFQYGMDG